MRADKIWVQVNGARQGMFLVGDDLSRPVLLFVHGGPGMPEYWLTQRRPVAFEELFTVAWWEQRGAGLSYRPRIPADEMTGERFVSDTIAVTNHLRERFGREKVYLMAHSWGSYLGLHAASRAPDLYHAYIGVAQMTHQIRSEALAYEHMLKRYRELGQTRMVRKLEEAPVTEATTPFRGRTWPSATVRCTVSGSARPGTCGRWSPVCSFRRGGSLGTRCATR